MRTFSSFVAEELEPHHKVVADRWASKANRERIEAISGHVIPPGQHKTVIPLSLPESEKPRASTELVDHLRQHGYEVHDYSAGLAKGGKYGRVEKIGRLLASTSAPSHLVNQFANDPKRNATRAQDDQEVVISRHPHDVCGMSTGRSWESCMTMGTGSYHEKLGHDVVAGTHVAYLVRKGDHDIKEPLARIALKPWLSHDNSHAVLRPESRSYPSMASAAFSHTVDEWAKKHFEPKAAAVYRKDPDLYDDDGSGHRMEADWKSFTKMAQVRAFTATVHPDRNSMAPAAKANPKFAQALANSHHSQYRSVAAAHIGPAGLARMAGTEDHPAIQREIAMRLEDSGNPKHLADAARKLVANPHLSSSVAVGTIVDRHPEHIDALLNHPNEPARTHTLKRVASDPTKPDHMKRLAAQLGDGTGERARHAAASVLHHWSEEGIDKRPLMGPAGEPIRRATAKTPLGDISLSAAMLMAHTGSRLPELAYHNQTGVADIVANHMDKLPHAAQMHLATHLNVGVVGTAFTATKDPTVREAGVKQLLSGRLGQAAKPWQHFRDTASSAELTRALKSDTASMDGFYAPRNRYEDSHWPLAAAHSNRSIAIDAVVHAPPRLHDTVARIGAVHPHADVRYNTMVHFKDNFEAARSAYNHDHDTGMHQYYNYCHSDARNAALSNLRNIADRPDHPHHKEARAIVDAHTAS